MLWFRRTLLLFLLLYGWSNTAAAQVPFTYSFSERYDFEPKTIYFLKEDSQRNIWISSSSGLYKFNGEGFQHFQNLNFSTSYTSIQEDPIGGIWCQNFTGQIFRVSGDSLKLFANEADNMVGMLDFTIAYYPKIYIGTDKQLIAYEFESSKREVLSNTENDLRYKDLRPYKQGFLFVRNNKVFFLSKNGKEQLLVQLPDGMRFESDPTVKVHGNDLFLLGNYFNGNEKVPYFFEWQKDKGLSQKKLEVSTAINAVSFSFESSQNFYWCGSRRGLYILDTTFTRKFPTLLNGSDVSDVIRDAEGNFWVATLEDGIHIIPSLEMLHFPKSQFAEDIVDVEQDRHGNIYLIGAQGKIYRLQNGASPELIGDMKEKMTAVNYNPYRHELIFEQLTNAFDLNNRKIVENPLRRGIKSVSFLSEESALVSVSNKAAVRTYRQADKKAGDTNKSNVGYATQPLREKRSYSNAIDKQSGLWYVAYVDGLYCHETDRETELLFDGRKIIPAWVAADQRSGVWCSTMDDKLLHIEGRAVTKQLDLNFKSSRIYPSGSSLFLISGSGILKVDTANGSSVLIDKLDGLPSNRILDMEITNDTAFVVTGEGVAKFSCNYDYRNETVPMVSFSKLSIWERDTTLQAKYELPHDENNLHIQFNAKALRSQKTFQYRYRMLGVDSNWISQNSEVNFARFPSLAPGNYTFQVKAVNEDGIESKPAQMNFAIAAPFYQKTWFFVLAGLALLLSTSLIFMVRIRAIQRRNRLLLDKENLEKKFSQSQLNMLRAQMNPHFVFNALNSIQEYIINNNKNLASDYLGLFADLMRKYLDFSQKNEASLEEEIETLQMYLQLEKMRFEDTLEYEIKIDPELDTTAIHIPMMLVQPLVENAIKHGLLHKKGGGKIDISFEKSLNELYISVEDDGIGREQSAAINKMRKGKHKSFATSALQKRIELINKSSENKLSFGYTDIHDENGQPSGTLVKIVIPL